MTTRITVSTHTWPVLVNVVDRSTHKSTCLGVERQTMSQSTTTETVPPNSSRDFHITDSRSISFYELPAPPAEAAETGDGV